MLRTIFIISFLIALISCKKEQEITQQNIVGLWEVEHGTNWSRTINYGNAPYWLGGEKSQLELASDNSFRAMNENELASFGTYEIIEHDIIFYADDLSPCLIDTNGCNSGSDQYIQEKSFTLEEIQSNRFFMKGDGGSTFGFSYDGTIYRYKRK